MSVQDNVYPLPLHATEIGTVVPCCHGAGCPLGVDAPAMAMAVASGDHARAYLIARSANPFASACGHGCHAPCESACRRRQFGAPVAISSLEAYSTGFSIPSLLASPEPCTSVHDARSVASLAGIDLESAALAPRSGRRVAVVGGGPAGMACAHDLRLLGHNCVVFDSSAEPGGLLTRGIPEFRFPLAGVRAECAAILAMGVEFRGEAALTGPNAINNLPSQGFDAVFLAVGASAPQKPSEESLELAQSRAPDAMDVLVGVAEPAGRIIVIGDGDLALDTARLLARRKGDTEPNSVSLVLTSRSDQSSVSPSMLAAALKDGVALYDGWSVARLLASPETAGVTGVEITRDNARSGRLLPCDHAVLATPRAPDVTTLGSGFALDGHGFVTVDPSTLATSLPWLWAGGACAFGHRSIAHAIADGKRAAWHIHAYLRGVRIETRTLSQWVEVEPESPERARTALEHRRAAIPGQGAVPADPFSSSALPVYESVLNEARRCFDCRMLPVVDERCTTCGTCVKICPTEAFSLTANGDRRLHFDQDKCTRCGICVEACPEGAIAMVRAVWDQRLFVSAPSGMAPNL